MRKLNILPALFLIVVLSGAGAYKLQPVPVQAVKNLELAKVDTVAGLLIFAYSQPVNQYKELAHITVQQRFTGEPKEQINTALKLIKKEYPEANGVIFTGNNMQQATIIKL